MRILMEVIFDEGQVSKERAELAAKEVVFVSEMALRQLLDRRNHSVDLDISARVED